MIKHSMAAPGRPGVGSTGARDGKYKSAGQQLYTPDHTRPLQPRHASRAQFHERRRESFYSPLDEGRRCSRCGHADRWRRWQGDVPGGWICCIEPADITVHGTLDHTCTELCALAVAI